MGLAERLGVQRAWQEDDAVAGVGFAQIVESQGHGCRSLFSLLLRQR
jgi:hypothetical protein